MFSDKKNIQLQKVKHVKECDGLFIKYLGGSADSAH
jgi:hypothetical protein